MAQSLAKAKRLDILGWSNFKESMFMKSKGNLTYPMMIGEPHNCLSTRGVRMSEEDTPGQVNAQAVRQKAIQEMVNFMWDSLHPLDRSCISKERDEDNLPAMWTKIKKQCMPD